jgi:hypothetical protein
MTDSSEFAGVTEGWLPRWPAEPFRDPLYMQVWPKEAQMEGKKWYASKMVWLGILITLQGLIPLVVEFLEKGPVSPAAVGSLLSGILVVILRVWFVDSPIV